MWRETCNEQYIKILGYVIDASVIAEEAKKNTSIPKRVKNSINQTRTAISNKLESSVQTMVGNGSLPYAPLEKLGQTPEYRPPGMILAQNNIPANQSAWGAFKNGLKDILYGFKDFTTQLMSFSVER